MAILMEFPTLMGKKGMHIEKPNNIILQMEIDYRQFRLHFEREAGGVGGRLLICLNCNSGNITRGGAKVHLARKHNDVDARYDLLAVMSGCI